MIQFDTKNNRKELNNGILYVFLFLCVLGILHHIPLTVDDRGFQNMSFATNTEALDYIIHYGNGRFLGNGGIIFLMHHLVISDIVRALMIAGVSTMLPKAMRIEGPEYPLLSLFLMLSISPSIFGQAYSWMSGFQNYVPPVFLFLFSIVLIQKGDSGRRILLVFRYVSILLMGVIMQFYIEHSSCLNCLAALLITVWSFRKQKCIFVGSLMLLIGTIIGLFLMFYATLFLAPMIHGGVDSYFSGGIRELFRGVLRNAVLLSGMYTENAVAISIMSSLLLAVMYQTRMQHYRKMKIGILAGLVIPSIIFIINLFSGLSPWYGKLMVFESGLLLIVFLWFSFTSVFAFYQLAKATKSREIKLAGLMFLAALVCILPILFVWPVGYRCLFHSSVMLFGSILLLIKERIVKETTAFGNKKVAVVAFILLATTVVSLTAIFSDIRRMVRIREEYLETVAEAGAEKAAFFTIPTPYIHELWNEDYVHYATVNGHTVQLEIVPADVWFQTYYYHYT